MRNPPDGSAFGADACDSDTSDGSALHQIAQLLLRATALQGVLLV
jgi:hypothetical protein